MTLEKINKIDIIFENCDFVSIPVKDNPDLLHFYMRGVKKNVGSANLNKYFHVYETAEEVYLEFSKESLEFPSFWEIKDGAGNILKNQLNFRDITSIHVYCEDKDYKYYVPYIEENESEIGSPNLNQINNWEENGTCRIEIKTTMRG